MKPVFGEQIPESKSYCSHSLYQRETGRSPATYKEQNLIFNITPRSTHNSAVCDEEVLPEVLVASLELVLADNHLGSLLRQLVHLGKET